MYLRRLLAVLVFVGACYAEGLQLPSESLLAVQAGKVELVGVQYPQVVYDVACQYQVPLVLAVKEQKANSHEAFSFSSVQCTIGEILYAICNQYGLKQSIDTATGVIWLYDESNHPDGLLNSPIVLANARRGVPFSTGILDDFFRGRFDDELIIGDTGQGFNPDARTPYPITLEAGTYSRREILNLAIVQSPFMMVHIKIDSLDNTSPVQYSKAVYITPHGLVPAATGAIPPGFDFLWRVRGLGDVFPKSDAEFQERLLAASGNDRLFLEYIAGRYANSFKGWSLDKRLTIPGPSPTETLRRRVALYRISQAFYPSPIEFLPFYTNCEELRIALEGMPPGERFLAALTIVRARCEPGCLERPMQWDLSEAQVLPLRDSIGHLISTSRTCWDWIHRRATEPGGTWPNGLQTMLQGEYPDLSPILLDRVKSNTL